MVRLMIRSPGKESGDVGDVIDREVVIALVFQIVGDAGAFAVQNVDIEDVAALEETGGGVAQNDERTKSSRKR